MEQPKLYDWLVVVFVHEVQAALVDSKKMIKDIQDVGATDKVAVFLVYDSLTVADKKVSFVLTVSRLEKAVTDDWVFMPIDPVHLKIDSTKSNRWEPAFRYIYTHYTGERNVLITYSEGAAFGINTEMGIGIDPPPPSQPVIKLPVQSIDLRGSGSQDPSLPDLQVLTNQYYVLDKKDITVLKGKSNFAPDELIPVSGNVWLIKKSSDKVICKNLEILWISKLAEALDRYLYGQYVDLMLMTNCFMQVFDTGYNLSNSVKFLIASEGAMNMRGYDYRKLMQTLTTCPETASKELARQVVKDLKQKFLDAGDIKALTNCTVFANRLKFYPLALRVFEDLIKELQPLLPKIACKLAAIRGQLDNVTGYDKYPLIDAGHWLKLVTEQVTELENGKLYLELFTKLQCKIAVENAVNDLLLLNENNEIERFRYSGISIYFPEKDGVQDGQQALHCATFDQKLRAPARSRLKWNIFLTKYFKALAACQKKEGSK